MAEMEALFRAHYGFILKYLMSLCHDGSLAEELTQETFFRAYINLTRLRDEAKAAAWLCSIARNLYYASYNRQKKHMPLEEISASEDMAQAVETKYLAAEVMACVSALEEPYREVFKLAVLGGVPLKEISVLYGKSESWARVTFHRAKQKVLERMK